MDITYEMFLNDLQRLNVQIRFCRRIISQKGTPTLMMKLITGDLNTYEKLINERTVHFLGRVSRIIERANRQHLFLLNTADVICSTTVQKSAKNQ